MPARVSGLADIAPMFPRGQYYPTTGLDLLNRFAAYAELYRRQVWVHVLVRKLSLGTARLQFEVRMRTGTWTELADNTHPLPPAPRAPQRPAGRVPTVVVDRRHQADLR